MEANKAHFVDLILEMGWWSEEGIEWSKKLLFRKVSVIYMTLSYHIYDFILPKWFLIAPI